MYNKGWTGFEEVQQPSYLRISRFDGFLGLAIRRGTPVCDTCCGSKSVNKHLLWPLCSADPTNAPSRRAGWLPRPHNELPSNNMFSKVFFNVHLKIVGITDTKFLQYLVSLKNWDMPTSRNNFRPPIRRSNIHYTSMYGHYEISSLPFTHSLTSFVSYSRKVCLNQSNTVVTKTQDLPRNDKLKSFSIFILKCTYQPTPTNSWTWQT